MFNFGAPKPAAPATTGSSLFGTSSSAATTGTTSQSASGFGFGGSTYQSANPVLGQQTAASSQSLISSFSTHPFQYIQQCYDTNSLNYRFRVPIQSFHFC